LSHFSYPENKKRLQNSIDAALKPFFTSKTLNEKLRKIAKNAKKSDAI